jgi:hypothetical protein
MKQALVSKSEFLRFPVERTAIAANFRERFPFPRAMKDHWIMDIIQTRVSQLPASAHHSALN